jgi:hypothetical protein
MNNNVYNRIYKEKKNSLIHYINHKSSFDLIIEKIIGEYILRFDSLIESNYFTIKNIIFNSHELFIHNNNASNLCLQNGIIKPILFLHQDISNIKREDLLLIKERLKSLTVINLEIKNSKNFEKTINISLPKFLIKETSNEGKICIINTSQDPTIIELKNTLNKSYKIDMLVDFIPFINYDSLVKYLSSYKLVIFSNPIDGMVAYSAGCQVLSSHNLIKHKRIAWDNTDQFDINYDFASFSKQIMKAIEI